METYELTTFFSSIDERKTKIIHDFINNRKAWKKLEGLEEVNKLDEIIFSKANELRLENKIDENYDIIHDFILDFSDNYLKMQKPKDYKLTVIYSYYVSILRHFITICKVEKEGNIYFIKVNTFEKLNPMTII